MAESSYPVPAVDAPLHSPASGALDDRDVISPPPFPQPFDIDGSSVMSRTSLYSYKSTSTARNRNRGYKTETVKNCSASRSNSSRRQPPQNSSDHYHVDDETSCCAASAASAGSGGRRSSRQSRSRRSHSYDSRRKQSIDDYYDRRSYSRDRDTKSSSRHEDDYDDNDSYYNRHQEERRDGKRYQRSNSFQEESTSTFSNFIPVSRKDKSRSPGRHARSRSWMDDKKKGPCSPSSQHQHSPPPAEEWPPCFENEGSAFVFDSRSAMFYESLSDFFYDPKSKLYYGNRRGAYFRYDATQDPPFLEVQKVSNQQQLDSVADGANSRIQHHAEQVVLPTSFKDVAGAVAAVPSKPKIAIKLKTKKVKANVIKQPASPPSGVDFGTDATTKAQKEQIAKIETWTEKQAELKQDSNVNTSHHVAMNPAAADTALSSNLSSTIVPSPRVRTTAKGEPICLLCKRKFPNIDKLHLHEQASDLHKKNLQKLQQQQNTNGIKRKFEDISPSASSAAAAADPTSSLSIVYQDRAEKRRQLHGPETHTHLNGVHTFSSNIDVSTLQEASNTGTAGAGLDETNVGHQMLQKLGWNGTTTTIDSSKATIENGNGTTAYAAAAAEAPANNSSLTTASYHLRKDWDRIEAMAASNSTTGPRR